MSKQPVLAFLIVALHATLGLAAPRSEQCPTNAEELLAKLGEFSGEIARSVNRMHGRNWREYKEWVDTCRARIAELDGNKCTANFVKYVTNKEKTTRPGHGLFYTMSNIDYIRSEPEAALDMPEELRNGLPDGWRADFERRGWKYIEFFSSSVPFGNPDDPSPAYRRLVVYIPNDRGYQKWIQFVPPQSQQLAIERVYHVDLISSNETPEGRKLQHHNQFVRGSISEPFRPKAPESLSSCFLCHANGPRQIRPQPGYVTEGNIFASGMNQLIGAAQEPFWGAAVDTAALGPALGDKKTCTMCHSGEDNGYGNAGYLHDLFSSEMIYSKMVKTLHMPPDFVKQERYKDLRVALDRLNDLTNAEKMKIRQTTNEDYSTLIKEMGRKGLLDKARASRALSQLEHARATQERNFTELYTDQEEILGKWLKGNRPECEAAK